MIIMSLCCCARLQYLPIHTRPAYRPPYTIAVLPSSLRDRLRRLNKEGVLTTATSDTCCEGSDHPQDHFLARLFGMERGPFCDSFHKVQNLTTSVYSPHPLLAEFSRYDLRWV